MRHLRDFGQIHFRKITDKMKIANIDLISHINTQELQQLIVNAPTVICRSGYSTLMDLMTLGKKAVLIPTPGQTEQEYLAKHLSQSGLFESISQKDFEEKYLNKYLLTGSAKNPEFKASEDIAT